MNVKDTTTLIRLASLDSAAASDALDTLKIQGAVPGFVNRTTGGKIVGRAVTVKIGLADGTPAKNHLGTQAIDASGVAAD